MNIKDYDKQSERSTPKKQIEDYEMPTEMPEMPADMPEIPKIELPPEVPSHDFFDLSTS